jgi:hypothetical protein
LQSKYYIVAQNSYNIVFELIKIIFKLTNSNFKDIEVAAGDVNIIGRVFGVYLKTYE